MKKFVLIFIGCCLFFLIQCKAQEYKRGNNWVTGYSGNKINFNTTIITTLGVNTSKYFIAGSSAISDTLGNLVCYSSGYDIFNSFGNIIEDGDTLVPKDFYLDQYGSSALSQSSMLLPKDSNTYYFITPAMSDTRFADCMVNINCYFDLLLYNVIDMNANAGAGKVVKRMQPLMQNANLRKTQMMACRHGNGKDWWLLKNEGDNGDVHTFLFTQDSVYDKGIQNFSNPVWGNWDLRGQSTFNADGTMFATTSDGSGSSTSLGLVFLADFDRCHGLLSSPKVLDMPWGSQQNPNDTTLMDKQSVGLCFSPNSKFLYVVSYTNVYQYDLQDSTWFHVAGLDTVASAAQGYETAYMGSDNRVYIGNFGGLSKQMSRIDNPDIKGAGCNFCPRCLRLDSLGANAYVGTPPCMPNYGLGAKTCWPLDTGNVNNIPEWDFYPNPATHTIAIRNAKGKRKILYDALGQTILSTSNEEIDVSGLSKGVYIIYCENKAKKVIVEK